MRHAQPQCGASAHSLLTTFVSLTEHDLCDLRNSLEPVIALATTISATSALSHFTNKDGEE
jgi:hypothetical protein